MGSSHSKDQLSSPVPPSKLDDMSVHSSLESAPYPTQEAIIKQQETLYNTPHQSYHIQPTRKAVINPPSAAHHSQVQHDSSHRPSITDQHWELPKETTVNNKTRVPLPVDLAVSLGKSAVTMGSFMYPSYLTFRALEQRDKKQQMNMLMFWTVNSAVQGLVALSDIWLHHYIPNEMVYTAVSLALKAMPTILGPDRVYRLYLRPFYHKYVEDEAERLIKEGELVKSKVLKEIDHQKQKHGLDSSSSATPSTTATSSSSTIKQDKQSSTQPTQTTIDYAHDNPATDAIDNRMLMAARSQVGDLDRRQESSASVVERDIITLKPTSLVTLDSSQPSTDLAEEGEYLGEFISPSSKAASPRDPSKKCEIQ